MIWQCRVRIQTMKIDEVKVNSFHLCAEFHNELEPSKARVHPAVSLFYEIRGSFPILTVHCLRSLFMCPCLVHNNTAPLYSSCLQKGLNEFYLLEKIVKDLIRSPIAIVAEQPRPETPRIPKSMQLSIERYLSNLLD